METQQYRELIQKLLDCVSACDHCATASLQEENAAHLADCIRLTRDCADICSQSDRLLQRDSEIALQFLLLCEEICRKCAEECSKHDHEHCQKCAEVCIACADVCHNHHEPITQD